MDASGRPSMESRRSGGSLATAQSQAAASQRLAWPEASCQTPVRARTVVLWVRTSIKLGLRRRNVDRSSPCCHETCPSAAALGPARCASPGSQRRTFVRCGSRPCLATGARPRRRMKRCALVDCFWPRATAACSRGAVCMRTPVSAHPGERPLRAAESGGAAGASHGASRIPRPSSSEQH